MSRTYVFGEVLFDCFPGGETVLGGAPFNVAWHLQALGDQPLFLSRVGADALGDQILAAMSGWGMDRAGVQQDPEHATGSVQVSIAEGEPSYEIRADVAYDFIDLESIPPAAAGDIVYHGSLALRSAVSRAAWQSWVADTEADLFMDVNLRDPWWQADDVKQWLCRARWAKMNGDELRALGYAGARPEDAMAALQDDLGVAEVIVTRGKEGALVRLADGSVHGLPPPPLKQRVDSVGAGDSFSAVYIHGVRQGWSPLQIIDAAQRFANGIIEQRGATPADRSFYDDFMEMIADV